jgi:DUF917 family protein
MKDFLGQVIAVGDFLATGGGGNTKCEYGMILYRVKEVKADALKVERLDVRYEGVSGKNIIILRKTSTIKAVTKVVKINPPQKMIDVFEKPEGNEKLVADWVHGKNSLDW